MSESFRPFSPEHWVTLAIGGAAIAGLILLGRRGGGSARTVTGLLAFLNLIAYPLNAATWATVTTEYALDNDLPLQLCDLTAFLAGFALLFRSNLLRELTYYWGLAGTLQALLTPAVTFGFPHPVFLSFFVQHFAIVGTALYLPLAIGWRPSRPLWRSPLRAFAALQLYLVAMLVLNPLLGTNFGFVSAPPDTPSLIDHLGPWPVYLLGLEAIAALALALLTLPFLRKSVGHRQNPAYIPPT